MIKVSMEVGEGATLSRATVQAESIREAVSITRGRYPGHDVRVMFPIDPEEEFLGQLSPVMSGLFSESVSDVPNRVSGDDPRINLFRRVT